MLKTSKQIVRMALLVMLFQFVCPAFLPLILQTIPTTKETTFSTQHNSIVVPLLLKEKDEKENGEFSSTSDSTPILDLSSHSYNLTASHENIRSLFSEEHRLPHPPLRTLFCTFLI